MKTKVILLIGLVLLAVGGTIAWICLSAGSDEVAQTPAQKRAAARAAKIQQAKARRKAQRTIGANGARVKLGQRAAKKTASARPRLVVEDDEKNLTARQKGILVDLQDSLDKENLQAVRSILDQFNDPALRTEKGEIPEALRSRAVEALGWFGKQAAIDLIGYLGDPNPEIAQDALNQFELALEDGEMSDLERSAIVKAAMKAITDTDIIDSLLTQLNNMRSSRRAETIVEILSTGTKQAKATMQEQLEDYTDEGVKDAEGVQKWLTENPDGEDDDDLYGGSKDADEDASQTTTTTPSTAAAATAGAATVK